MSAVGDSSHPIVQSGGHGQVLWEVQGQRDWRVRRDNKLGGGSMNGKEGLMLGG